MSDARVREAREDEVPTVLEMYGWLFEPPGYTPRAWNRLRAAEALRETMASASSSVLVAEIVGGELAGFLTAYLDLNSVRYGPRCWVEDLAVRPAQRSAGIGKLLLDAAKVWARERGATHLELDTGLARTDAQRFYDREQPALKGYSYSWEL